MDLINADGRVTRWPRKREQRLIVLDHLAALFERGRSYPEKEINEILKAGHLFGDWALLRRELFESGRLDRDAKSGLYWRI